MGYYSQQYGLSGIEQSMNDTLKGQENFASWSDVVNYPVSYTHLVLVNPDDDQRLFGFYPTLAGECETRLAATASADGLATVSYTHLPCRAMPRQGQR